MVKIAPSLLAANFGRLAEELKRVEEAGADLLHVDVMDGHFVPNLTVGVPIVSSLRKETKLPLDVHLMIDNPASFIHPFAEAGADILTIHVEIQENIREVLLSIKEKGVKTGLALNPETDLSWGMLYLEQGMVDLLLLMSVHPGFGGQEFIPEVLPKIEKLRRLIEEKGWKTEIEVDGGVNAGNAPGLIKAGVDILVAGTAIFGQKDTKKAIVNLRGK